MLDTTFPTTDTEHTLFERIKALLSQKNAVLVAHYYVDSNLQELAEATGGFVGDSLEMARFGKHTSADMIIVAGVRFMGETAKILSPEKQVHVLDMSATCSLDEGCEIAEFNAFCDAHPEREVVVYANTSAKVKARADWMVTSSSAIDVVNDLHAQGKAIIWAPDKHLGNYVAKQTGADMILWDSTCIVHDEFKADGITQLKALHPEAKVLVHPESPREVVKLADVVGSTTMLIHAVQKQPKNTFIIATDNGIFHKMKQVSPEATLIEAPTHGEGADCESCAHCPWMAMNSVEQLLHTLETNTNEIQLESAVIEQAQQSITNLLDFTARK